MIDFTLTVVSAVNLLWFDRTKSDWISVSLISDDFRSAHPLRAASICRKSLFPSSCRGARQRETNIRSIFHLSPQMGHARPPAGLINRVQDAGTVRKNMSFLPLALFTLFMVIAKLSRIAEREKNRERDKRYATRYFNALFYRDADKNNRRDWFRTEKYLSITIVARRLRADKNTFAVRVYVNNRALLIQQ